MFLDQKAPSGENIKMNQELEATMLSFCLFVFYCRKKRKLNSEFMNGYFPELTKALINFKLTRLHRDTK